MRLILFDIDSTLLRDGGAAGRAFNRAFEEQFSVLPAAIDKHGKTDPNITREITLATFGRVLTSNEEHHLHSRYRELLPAYLDESVSFSVLPGAAELCAMLNDDPSNALGIQTGNLEPCAMAKLRKAQMDKYFRLGGFGSDSADRTALVRLAIERGRAATGWKFENDDVIVIGDSPFDIRAGKSNNAFTIGVMTGNATENELMAAGADAVVIDLIKTSGIWEILNSHRS